MSEWSGKRSNENANQAIENGVGRCIKGIGIWFERCGDGIKELKNIVQLIVFVVSIITMIVMIYLAKTKEIDLYLIPLWARLLYVLIIPIPMYTLGIIGIIKNKKLKENEKKLKEQQEKLQLIFTQKDTFIKVSSRETNDFYIECYRTNVAIDTWMKKKEQVLHYFCSIYKEPSPKMVTFRKYQDIIEIKLYKIENELIEFEEGYKRIFTSKDKFKITNKKENDEKIIYTIDTTVNIEKWENKRVELMHLHKTSGGIDFEKNQEFHIKITIYKHNIPKCIIWDKDKHYTNKHGVFNIGLTHKGIAQIDFNKVANLLIGGEPGSGKSALIILIACLAIIQRARVFIGDFKGLDFQYFEKYSTVVYEHKELLDIFHIFRKEMKRRKLIFRDAGVLNYVDYIKKTGSNMKRWYLIIDEIGEALEIVDFDSSDREDRKLESVIAKQFKSLARLGRAYGLNCVGGTQKPEVVVLEGQTRDMFGQRVCYKGEPNLSRTVLNNAMANQIERNAGRGIKKNDDTTYSELQTYFLDIEDVDEVLGDEYIIKKEQPKVKEDSKTKDDEPVKNNNDKIDGVDIPEDANY